MTTKNDTSKNMEIPTIPPHCDPAYSKIREWNLEHSPNHVTCVGPYYPWVYAFLQDKNGGRIDAIYQTKDLQDGDMVVAYDVLQSNVTRNEVRRAMNLPLTDLEIHVRNRSEKLPLDDATFRFANPDCLFLTPGSQENLNEVTRMLSSLELNFNFLILLTPQTNPYALDPHLNFLSLIESKGMVIDDVVHAEEDSFGLYIFKNQSK